jgi:hypothetical protein
MDEKADLKYGMIINRSQVKGEMRVLNVGLTKLREHLRSKPRSLRVQHETESRPVTLCRVEPPDDAPRVGMHPHRPYGSESQS